MTPDQHHAFVRLEDRFTAALDTLDLEFLQVRDRIARFLLMANASGITACIAAMGLLYQESQPVTSVEYPIYGFFIGFCSIAFLHVLDYFSTSQRRGYLQDIANAIKTNQPYDDAMARYEQSRKWPTVNAMLIFTMSLIIFIYGSYSTIRTVFAHTNQPPPPACSADFLSATDNHGKVCTVVIAGFKR